MRRYRARVAVKLVQLGVLEVAGAAEVAEAVKAEHGSTTDLATVVAEAEPADAADEEEAAAKVVVARSVSMQCVRPGWCLSTA